jgi:HSP20 family protein
MALNHWNPTRDIMTLFDETYGSSESSGSRVARLPIDAYSTDDAIIVSAAVPGVNPDDVEITVEGETLTIRGGIYSRIDNVNYIISERFDGAFSRTLQLNVPVDVDKIEASFENGILTLVLPKAEEVRPKVIKVKAK